ncbi:MAG: hypothetical protein AAB418_01660 [candidate division NC10 bacterium]
MSVWRRGLTTSLVLLAVAFGYALTQGRVERPALPRPSGVAPSPRVPPPLPSARDILDRRASLALGAEQTRRLEALAREWSSESARLEAELQTATAEFSRFMGEAQGRRGTSLQAIQHRSADVSELSARLREQRRLHGEVAAGLLTEAQRGRLAHPVPDTPGGTR